MKKKILRTARLAMIIIMASFFVFGMVGCNSQKDGTKKKVVSDNVKNKLTEKDLEEIITGLDDHYILENAKNIDYLHGIKYDEGIIKKVKEDQKNVDLTKPGKYTATYTVSVDVRALEEYHDSKTENENNNDLKKDQQEGVDDASTAEANSKDKLSNAANQNKETNESETTDAFVEGSTQKVADEEKTKEDRISIDPTGNEKPQDVEIDKEIEVVDEDKAKELADQGKVVWTDDNDTVPKSDGSKVEDRIEEPDSTNPSGDSNASSTTDTENNVGTSTETVSSGSNENTENSGVSEGGNSSTPSQPVGCSHNWQSEYTKGEAPGHWQEIPEYTTIYIYVCHCGKEFTNGSDYDIHAAFECNIAGYSIEERQQQTGSHKEWVVDGPAPDVPTGRMICTKCGAVK